MSQPVRKLHWDFFGPHAEGTARHYLRHLHTFIEQHSLGDCESGVHTLAPNHFGTWCIAASAGDEQKLIEQLRPRRATAVDGANPADTDS
ncbi:MAG: hypothetical protein ACPG4T_06575 [Nannocystaceae bacterium]